MKTKTYVCLKHHLTYREECPACKAEIVAAPSGTEAGSGSSPSTGYAPSPTQPAVSLLVKLGSIAVHVEEMMSESGHGFDKIALEQLLSDAEVKSWIGAMDKLAMLPVKR